jgi:hypothetical protein
MQYNCSNFYGKLQLSFFLMCSLFFVNIPAGNMPVKLGEHTAPRSYFRHHNLLSRTRTPSDEWEGNTRVKMLLTGGLLARIASIRWNRAHPSLRAVGFLSNHAGGQRSAAYQKSSTLMRPDTFYNLRRHNIDLCRSLDIIIGFWDSLQQP